MSEPFQHGRVDKKFARWSLFGIEVGRAMSYAIVAVPGPRGMTRLIRTLVMCVCTVAWYVPC